MNRRTFVSAAALSALPLAAAAARPAPASDEVRIHLDRATGAFPHYWEGCVGSDRASVGMRSAWREDLALAHRRLGLKSVRFHGLLDDDMGVCLGVDDKGPITNFLYVDQVFDAMLALGVRPFVELGFMPAALASSQNTIFWYRGNTSPPARMADWSALVGALAAHLVDRYGIEEVAGWRFECWNEPNLGFWAGTQAQYFELYRHTAAALKAVERRLQVGGPATSQTMWIAEFLADCAKHGTPVDFVSTHIYADDPQENIFGRADLYPYDEVMPRALRQVKDQIGASAYPNAPLIVSEWSSQDPAFIGQMVRDCSGLAETMSYWTFSNVFEETGPVHSFRNDAYGLIGWGGVPRPSFHAFELLHRLGETRLEAGQGPVLATRRADGSAALLAWRPAPAPPRGGAGGNPMVLPTGQAAQAAEARPLRLRLDGAGVTRATVTIVDPAKDPALAAYVALGRPAYPTARQIAELRAAAEQKDVRQVEVRDGRVELALTPSSLALVEIG
jgi:xylan 1,4-beta-xylosidase